MVHECTYLSLVQYVSQIPPCYDASSRVIGWDESCQVRIWLQMLEFRKKRALKRVSHFSKGFWLGKSSQVASYNVCPTMHCWLKVRQIKVWAIVASVTEC